MSEVAENWNQARETSDREFSRRNPLEDVGARYILKITSSAIEPRAQNFLEVWRAFCYPAASLGFGPKNQWFLRRM
jgi:hypothetical protein